MLVAPLIPAACARTFTVAMVQRAIRVTYAGPRVSDPQTGRLNRYVLCSRNPHARRFLHGYWHREIGAWKRRLHPALPYGQWTIPAPIVMCESRGQNLPPNSATASGYYQIIDSTWRSYGGSTQEAYLAPKPQQDQVAARIWAGGSGASQWDCARLVRWTP